MFPKKPQMFYMLLLISSVIYVVNTDCLDEIAKILEFKTVKTDGICLMLKANDNIDDNSINDLVQSHCNEVEKQNFQQLSQRFEKINCNIKKRSKRNIFGGPNCACIRAPCDCEYIPPVTPSPVTRLPVTEPPYQEPIINPNCACIRAPCYCGYIPQVTPPPVTQTPVTPPPVTRPPYQEPRINPNCACIRAPCYCGYNPEELPRPYPVARRIKLSAPRSRRAQYPWAKYFVK